MAKFTHALQAYTPKIKLGKQATTKELAAFIEDRKGLNKGEVYHLLYDLKDAIHHFCGGGQSLKIENIGSFRPSIGLDGKISIIYVIDPELNVELNRSNCLSGKIENSNMIGKTCADLVRRWNKEHPEDLIAQDKG